MIVADTEYVDLSTPDGPMRADLRIEDGTITAIDRQLVAYITTAKNDVRRML